MPSAQQAFLMTEPPTAVRPIPPTFDSAEAFLAAFASSTGALVSYVDREERVCFASGSLAAWFGETEVSIVGKQLAELHPEGAYEHVAPYIRRALAGEDVHYERAVSRLDGGSSWLSVDMRPHRDASGCVIGTFTCALEVRELKRTHDALGRALDEIASHI